MNVYCVSREVSVYITKEKYTRNYEPTKKNLKIPKGQSESVYRRGTDKRKSTKGQTTIYKTYI
jgi:hypothetical protein